MLRRDPMIGSAAIAEQLGTTRAAVNVHLSNLGKKGVILKLQEKIDGESLADRYAAGYRATDAASVQRPLVLPPGSSTGDPA